MRPLLSILLLSATALAQPKPAAPAKPPPPPPPSDERCKMPPLTPLLASIPGELLEFSLDALGAEAGKMEIKTLPVKKGALRVEANVETNTFFSKVRKVRGGGTSYLDPKTLRPSRYIEDLTENDIHRRVEVNFLPAEKKARVQWKIGEKSGKSELRSNGDALDNAGVIAAIRQLPYRQGLEVCFDAYASRRMWRVSGQVLELEEHTTPLGHFKVWHLAGEAVRLDNHHVRREVHVYVTDDARRLPLAALGMIDLGAVRATLVRYVRPGEKTAKAQGSESLKW